jgi:hypothetical protein
LDEAIDVAGNAPEDDIAVLAVSIDRTATTPASRRQTG